MKKYIVPAKGNLEKWKSFFESTFRTDEHQEDLLKVLVTLTMWLSSAESISDTTRRESLINMCDQALQFAGGLSETGLLDEDNVIAASQMACEFATALYNFLKGAGVIQGPTVLRFSGFTGMDITIKVFAPGEVEDVDEQTCLNG